MSPKVNQEHKEERKMQILKAAFMCFYKKGYQQTTMRDICSEAKLSTGAVYSYFPSKQEIVRALADYGEENNQMIFLKKIKSKDPLERLKFIILHYIKIFEKKEALPGLTVDLNLQSAALQDKEIYKVVQKSIQNRVDSIKQLLNEAKKKRLINKSVNVDQSAHIILSLLIGTVQQKLFDSDFDMKAYHKEVERWMQNLFPN